MKVRKHPPQEGDETAKFYLGWGWMWFQQQGPRQTSCTLPSASSLFPHGGLPDNLLDDATWKEWLVWHKRMVRSLSCQLHNKVSNQTLCCIQLLKIIVMICAKRESQAVLCVWSQDLPVCRGFSCCNLSYLLYCGARTEGNHSWA